MAGVTGGRLAGRTALVVGGGTDGPAAPGETLPMGNGLAITMRLAAEGASVAVTDVSAERAEETVAALGGSGLAIEADAADPDACRAAVDRAVAGLGPLDVVVCNVGIGGGGPIGRQTVEQYDLAMDVNVRSHWVTAKRALPGMVERGRGAFVFLPEPGLAVPRPGRRRRATGRLSTGTTGCTVALACRERRRSCRIQRRAHRIPGRAARGARHSHGQHSRGRRPSSSSSTPPSTCSASGVCSTG